MGSCVVTLIYWTFSVDDMGTAIEFQVFKHGVGLAVMLLDTVLCRYPCHIMHCIYGWIYGLSFVLFTYILYQSAKLVDPDHETIPEKVYWFLDWDSGAVMAVLVSLVVIPVTTFFQVILFLLCRLRVHLHQRRGLRSSRRWKRGECVKLGSDLIPQV